MNCWNFRGKSWAKRLKRCNWKWAAHIQVLRNQTDNAKTLPAWERQLLFTTVRAPHCLLRYFPPRNSKVVLSGCRRGGPVTGPQDTEMWGILSLVCPVLFTTLTEVCFNWHLFASRLRIFPVKAPCLVFNSLVCQTSHYSQMYFLCSLSILLREALW